MPPLAVGRKHRTMRADTMNGEQYPRPAGTFPGWLMWLGGVGAIGLCMQLGVATLPTLGAALALLVVAALGAVIGTALCWPDRRDAWRGHRLSLGVAIVALLVVTALAALYQAGLFGLRGLTM